MATIPRRERSIAPDVRAGAKQEGVDEGQHHTGGKQPVRGPPRPLHMAVVDPMDPARVEVQEIEHDVADV